MTARPEAPWRVHPDIAPGDIFWRMGGGEDVLSVWLDWIGDLPDADRQSALRDLRPIPDAWLLFAAEAYALPDTDDEAVEDALGVLSPED